MKQLLSYTRSDYKFNSSQVMVLKLGRDYMAYAITESTGTELYELVYCKQEELTAETLAAFIKDYPAFANSYKQIRLVYDLPRNAIMPYAEPADRDLIISASQLSGNLASETVSIAGLEGWQLRNCFAKPVGSIDEIIQKRLRHVDEMHQHDVFIRCLGAGIDEGELLADFTPDQFVLVARRKSRLLFAGYFDYETPTDVLYYLLKIAEQFSLSPLLLALRISGLVDRDSALYKELYQYFIHISFREADWGAVEDYPAHYFTTFNDVAKCVS